MAVFVDRLVPTPRSSRWRYDSACHLIADSLEELHAFAKRLGLRKSWFQADSVLPHYNLTARRREKALEAGAIEVSREFMGKRIAEARQREAPRRKMRG